MGLLSPGHKTALLLFKNSQTSRMAERAVFEEWGVFMSVHILQGSLCLNAHASMAIWVCLETKKHSSSPVTVVFFFSHEALTLNNCVNGLICFAVCPGRPLNNIYEWWAVKLHLGSMRKLRLTKQHSVSSTKGNPGWTQELTLAEKEINDECIKGALWQILCVFLCLCVFSGTQGFPILARQW